MTDDWQQEFREHTRTRAEAEWQHNPLKDPLIVQVGEAEIFVVVLVYGDVNVGILQVLGDQPVALFEGA